jgi:hypothetical protein
LQAEKTKKVIRVLSECKFDKGCEHPLAALFSLTQPIHPPSSFQLKAPHRPFKPRTTLDDYELSIECFDRLTYGQRIWGLIGSSLGLLPPVMPNLPGSC